MFRVPFDPAQAGTTDGQSPDTERHGPINHQTVRLSKGRHGSPEHGACVMELASMLAGEPFSDHPESACPVIGSFLRTYNDAIDDDRRQDLYAYASKVVGSRSTEAVQRIRSERLLAWAAKHERPWRRGLTGLPRLGRSKAALEAAGTHAVAVIRRHTDRSHAEVLALIDELLRIDAGGDAAEPGARPDRWELTAERSSSGS